jgi:hypothetical protein
LPDILNSLPQNEHISALLQELQSAGQAPPVNQEPASPPPPEWIDSRPDPDTETQIIKDVMDTLPALLKESAANVEAHSSYLDRLDAFYENNAYYDELRYWGREGSEYWRSRQGATNRTGSYFRVGDPDKSQYVEPIAHIIDGHASRRQLKIFSGPEWVTVKTAPGAVIESTAENSDLEMAIQQKLIECLKRGNIQDQFMLLVKGMLKYGVCCGYTYLHRKRTLTWQQNTATGEIRPGPLKDSEKYPLVMSISPRIWLPDFGYKGVPDVQRMRFFAWRIFKTWEEIETHFMVGEYTHNVEEARNNFKDAGRPIADSAAYCNSTSTDNTNNSEDKYLQVIPFYYTAPTTGVKDEAGNLITPGGPYECRGTLITTVEDVDFNNAILVRLEPGNGTVSGRRPLFICQEYETDNPYGQGLLQRLTRPCMSVSDAKGRLSDLMRKTCAGQMIVRDSDLLEALTTNKSDYIDMVNSPKRTEELMAPVPAPTQDMNALNEVIRDGMTQLQAMSLEIPSVERPTTGDSNIRAEQQSAPTSVALNRLAGGLSSFACNEALGFLPELVEDEEYQTICQAGGVKTIKLTKKEVKAGKWTAQIALTDQDTTAQAAANNLIQLIGMWENVTMAMKSEGKKIIFSELFMALLHKLNIPGVEQIIQPDDLVATMTGLLKSGVPPQEIEQAIQQAAMQLAQEQAQQQGGAPQQGPQGLNGRMHGTNQDIVNKQNQMNADSQIQPRAVVRPHAV